MLRLVMIALDNWREIEGFAVSQGLEDLRKMRLGRFCSFIYWYATRNAEDEASKRKFDARLWQPPPGEVAKGPWSPEAETAAFAGLKAGLSG
jgi:hypothetical protein